MPSYSNNFIGIRRSIDYRKHKNLKVRRTAMGIMKSNSDFLNEVQKLVGEEYQVLEPYKGSKTKINFFHQSCGNIFSMQPNQFLNGQRCPNCARKRLSESLKSSTKMRQKSIKHAKELIENLKESYIIEVDFDNFTIMNETECNVFCKKCGNSFKKKLVYMRDQKCPCPFCHYDNLKNRPRQSADDFRKEVFNLVGDEYDVLEDYETGYKKILFRHNKCGKTFKMQPRYFKMGCRCIHCANIGSNSKPNKRISELLESKDILFVPEISFDDLKNRNKLPFDFGVFKNDKLIFLLEYDGKQHFEPIFGEERLIETIKNDEKKNRYCLDKGIPLERISFNENIENRIEEIIEKYF